MLNQKGLLSPLLIFGVVALIIAAGALYYFGFFKAPGSAPEPEPAILPPLEPATSTQTPAPSAYSNPFSENESYENPFDNL